MDCDIIICCRKWTSEKKEKVQEQTFRTEELKVALEQGLGFSLRSLERLDGASALNFKAIRATDGMPFVVKCLPQTREAYFRNLVHHLDELAGTKAVGRLFADCCPPVFCGHSVVCMTWCSGDRVFPDRLTPQQFDAFLADYRIFSEVLQKSNGIFAPEPVKKWLATLDAASGLWGRWTKALVSRVAFLSDVAYHPERLRVIHGDFHHGNFLFESGRLVGFFDLEEFMQGYPADDIVRYVVCAAEHLKWFEYRRRHVLVERLAQAVRTMGYPRDEWMSAVDRLFLRKVVGKVERGLGPWSFVNLSFRAGFYRELKAAVAQADGE